MRRKNWPWFCCAAIKIDTFSCLGEFNWLLYLCAEPNAWLDTIFSESAGTWFAQMFTYPVITISCSPRKIHLPEITQKAPPVLWPRYFHPALNFQNNSLFLYREGELSNCVHIMSFLMQEREGTDLHQKRSMHHTLCLMLHRLFSPHHNLRTVICGRRYWMLTLSECFQRLVTYLRFPSL